MPGQEGERKDVQGSNEDKTGCRRTETRKRRLHDLILPEFRKVLQFAQTGGDSEEMAMLEKALAANTNPFKRKTDKPAVFWSNIVDVDGSKTVTYQIPSGFNGNLKVMLP